MSEDATTGQRWPRSDSKTDTRETSSRGEFAGHKEESDDSPISKTVEQDQVVGAHPDEQTRKTAAFRARAHPVGLLARSTQVRAAPDGLLGSPSPPTTRGKSCKSPVQ